MKREERSKAKKKWRVANVHVRIYVYTCTYYLANNLTERSNRYAPIMLRTFKQVQA